MDTKTSKQPNSDHVKNFPPVVSVVGHVDHGKTTLLDTIRKSSIAAREKGGITQKIGASQIEVTHEGSKRLITFIDTPGHEAFASMRSNGVSASDIVLLIIAADDGIKPQTLESIQKIKESKLPYIVVITKMDAHGAQVDRVKQSLLKEEIMLEDFGGQVPSIQVSAKTNQNIDALLDLILLVYDVSPIEKDAKADFMGVIIDSKLDKRRGVTASIIVKQGMVEVGARAHTAGRLVGKFRALFDTALKPIKTAKPGDAIEVLGFEDVLPTGTILFTKETEMLPVVVSQAVAVAPMQDLAVFFGEKSIDTVRIVLKTETSGELEAIRENLPEKAEIAYGGQGEISSSDILMAKDLGAIVVGFNVPITRDAEMLARTEKVFHRLYTIIYELLDEIKEAIEGLGESKVEAIGEATILAKFEGERAPILGIKVTEGRIAVNDSITIYKGDTVIGTAKIVTLHKGKQEAQTATKNVECGIQILPLVDFSVGDVIISHK